ncbi:MAG: 30S ribosomal protein S6 [Firmicutes bacterium]|nr:30S ribosomal protein S6 [Bacillota bacterium]
MNRYEVLYILSSKLEDEAREAEINKYSAAVAENGGETEKVDKWGVKKFAYPIDYKKDGYYVLMTFKAKPEFPAELERRMRIADHVIRFKTQRLG